VSPQRHYLSLTTIHFLPTAVLTKLIDKETGEQLFNVIRVGQVCPPCQKTTTPW
jgi:hypothetical protein